MKSYYYLHLLLVFLIFFKLDANANYCYTLGDGNWDDTANWSCGYVPGSGDTIVISAGDTIYVETPYNGYTGVWLQVFGCLDFKNAVRLVFAYGDTAIPPSTITFFSGSSCINGNGSSGLSFGAGGSGCDVYRPASGANPGVYPTIPGSYYDGCVHSSYLNVGDFWAHADIIEDHLYFEWEIHEDPNIIAYELLGERNGALESVYSIDSRADEKIERYDATIPILDFEFFVLYLIDLEGSKTQLTSVNIAHLTKLKSSVHAIPNPFTTYITLKDNSVFNYVMYNSTGTAIMHDDGASSYIIDTQEFSKGVYILEIIKDGNVVDHLKVMK